MNTKLCFVAESWGFDLLCLGLITLEFVGLLGA
jgi:hypothetical protein